MSIGAVAFVPSAPLLVPAVAGGSAPLDAALRAASLEVVARAIADRPDEVVVVAALPSAGQWSETTTWDFGGFGVARTSPDPRERLPWPLGIGAWLLDQVGWEGRRRYVGVAGSTPSAAAGLGDSAVSVVVVADGSACRGERAPGHLDERAESFDDAVAARLATGDAVGFSGLDAQLGEELQCSGVLAWRWMAAALSDTSATTAELAMHVAPYGVGYFVAFWSFA